MCRTAWRLGPVWGARLIHFFTGPSDRVYKCGFEVPGYRCSKWPIAKLNPLVNPSKTYFDIRPLSFMSNHQTLITYLWGRVTPRCLWPSCVHSHRSCRHRHTSLSNLTVSLDTSICCRDKTLDALRNLFCLCIMRFKFTFIGTSNNFFGCLYSDMDPSKHLSRLAYQRRSPIWLVIASSCSCQGIQYHFLNYSSCLACHTKLVKART